MQIMSRTRFLMIRFLQLLICYCLLDLLWLYLFSEDKIFVFFKFLISLMELEDWRIKAFFFVSDMLLFLLIGRRFVRQRAP